MSNLQPKQFVQQRLFDDAPYDDGPRRDPDAISEPEPTGDLGYQTRMLMPTREVINNVHKIDSPLMDDDEFSTPAEQWADIKSDKSDYFVRKAIARREPVPPIRIQHRNDLPAHYQAAEPELWDGHHRLSEYEDAGHTEVPVWESFDNRENGYDVQGGRRAGGGYSGNPYWRSR